MKNKLFIGTLNALVLSFFFSASYAQDLHVNPAVNDCSIELDPSLTQSQFRKFIMQGSLIGSFKVLAPAEPLGAKKFEIGIVYFYSPIDDKDPAWNNTFTHPDEKHYLGNAIDGPKLYARIGVSGRVDVGFNFTKNPSANYGFLGGEIKYAFLKESENTLAAAVRTSYVTLLGVDDVDFGSYGVDFSISKNIGMFTPYLGIGGILARGGETTSKLNLDKENVLAAQGFVGLEFSVSIINLMAEMDIAEVSTFSFRTGFNF